MFTFLQAFEKQIVGLTQLNQFGLSPSRRQCDYERSS